MMARLMKSAADRDKDAVRVKVKPQSSILCGRFQVLLTYFFICLYLMHLQWRWRLGLFDFFLRSMRVLLVRDTISTECGMELWKWDVM